jgi:hypothetical protein
MEARMVEVPLARPVTRPWADTVATAWFELLQVIAVPDMELPFLSFTWAENCWVNPMASRVTLEGVTATLVGTGDDVESEHA